MQQGHLVKMTCGHRGIPCRTEEKRVSRLLRKSGFIPMLETVEQMKEKALKKKQESLQKKLSEKTK